MTLILPRRQFLLGLGAMLAAPAIVRAESLMHIRALPLDIAYAAPTARGIGDGSSLLNAAGARDIPQLVKKVGRGGTIVLASGNYGSFEVTSEVGYATGPVPYSRFWFGPSIRSVGLTVGNSS